MVLCVQLFGWVVLGVWWCDGVVCPVVCRCCVSGGVTCCVSSGLTGLCALCSSMGTLSEMFELELAMVHSIISKMIINEELMVRGSHGPVPPAYVPHRSRLYNADRNISIDHVMCIFPNKDHLHYHYFTVKCLWSLKDTLQ